MDILQEAFSRLAQDPAVTELEAARARFDALKEELEGFIHGNFRRLRQKLDDVKINCALDHEKDYLPGGVGYKITIRNGFLSTEDHILVAVENASAMAQPFAVKNDKGKVLARGATMDEVQTAVVGWVLEFLKPDQRKQLKDSLSLTQPQPVPLAGIV